MLSLFVTILLVDDDAMIFRSRGNPILFTFNP